MWAMAKNNGAEGLLMRAEEVSCANSVLNIYKYTNVIEKFLYYLMSRNLKYVNFYEQGARKAE